jgi:hypothetical protein
MTKMKFVRFGGLSPVKQTHYETGEDKGFHNPPRRRGLYAFPYPYIERFLLGATDDPTNISHKTQWLKDENGNKIKSEDFHGDYDPKTDKMTINPKYIKLLKKLGIQQKDIWGTRGEDNISYVTVMKRPRTFEYDGDIWHHLGHRLKPEQILGVSGSWTKSTMDDYFIALTLEFRSAKKDMIKTMKEYTAISDLMKKDPYKSHFAKDILEVFIEQL